MAVDVLKYAQGIIESKDWRRMRAVEQRAVVQLLKVTVDSRISKEKHDARQARIAAQVRRAVKKDNDGHAAAARTSAG